MAKQKHNIDIANIFLSDTEKDNIEYAFTGLKDQTKKTYKASVHTFFAIVKKKPEELTPDDIKNFFNNTCSEYVTKGIWEKTYYRHIIFAVKKYLTYRFSEKQEDGSIKNVMLAAIEETPASPPPATQTITPEGLTQYLKVIADYEDKSLLTAVALAYGAALAPKEIVKLKARHLSKDNDKLILSVGEGKNHRYIELPTATASILLTYIKDKGITDRDSADIFTANNYEKGSVDLRLRRQLDGLRYRFQIPGIDDKMNIQQFRTISLASMSRQRDYSLITAYAKVTRAYVYSVKSAYMHDDNPNSNLQNALDASGLSYDYDIPDWVKDFEPLDEHDNERYIAPYPLED